MIGGTCLGIMVLYMDNSGERKSLPYILILRIARKVLSIILIYLGKFETLVTNRTWSGDLLWL